MVNLAVFCDYDKSIVEPLRSTGKVCRVAGASQVDPAVHDALIIDGRTNLPDEFRHTSSLGKQLPVIIVLDAQQVIPDIPPDYPVSDFASVEDLPTTAFAWRLKQVVARFQRPLSVDTLHRPEHQLLSELVDHLSDWVFIKSLDHRFLLANDDFAKTVGLPKENIIGRNDLEIGTDEEAVMGNPDTGWIGFWRQDDDVIASGVPASEENLNWRAFAISRRYKRTVRVPLRNARGEIYGLLVVASDITDRVLAERNLQSRNLMLRRVTEEKLNAEQHRQIAEKAVSAKNKFLAAASHDLRQPMHALGLFLTVLERRIDHQENQLVLQKMRHSCEALNALFNSLLDISRLDAGVVEVSIQTFCLRDLLTSIRDEFMQLGEARSIDVRIESCGAVVSTDPVLFGRIMRNLLQNALTHTDEGMVSVRCHERGDKLIIDVSDTGPGIPEQQQDAVFSEYYQLESTTDKPTKGLGLGLAIVRKLTELLDIDISLKSKVNEGCTFTLTVPLGNLDEVARPRNSSHFQQLAGNRILLIDDEADIREALSLILESVQCQTISAESSEQALQLLEKDGIEPDIMIVDYRLREGRTGNTAIDNIRNHFGRTIPAIIVTGDTSEKRMRDAKQTGCQLLHKPVDAKNLLRAVARTLDKELVTE